jgi:hypothetical protein
MHYPADHIEQIAAVEAEGEAVQAALAAAFGAEARFVITGIRKYRGRFALIVRLQGAQLSDEVAALALIERTLADRNGIRIQQAQEPLYADICDISGVTLAAIGDPAADGSP